MPVTVIEFILAIVAKDNPGKGWGISWRLNEFASGPNWFAEKYPA